MRIVKLLLKFALGAFVLLMIAFAFSDKKAPSSTSATENASATTSQEAPLPEFPAGLLVTEYDENSVAADAKFKNKRFIVYGSVASINTNMMGDAYISFKGTSPLQEPQATLSDEHKAYAGTVKKGEKIKLACTGNGDIVKTPMLKDCGPI